jgi:hypothetical protein
MPIALCSAVLLLSLGSMVARAAVEPGIALRDDGRFIIYRARPGDTATAIAKAMGVAREELDAMLAAQGIRDPDRVPVGFEYRIENPLVTRVDAAERRAAQLREQLVASEHRAAEAEPRPAPAHQAEPVRADLQRLAQLEGRWRLAFWAIVGLSLALACAGALAAVAHRRMRGAMHFARSMANELDEKRRNALAERQQSARRIVDLEDRVRQLEAHAAERVRGVPRSA